MAYDDDNDQGGGREMAVQQPQRQPANAMVSGAALTQAMAARAVEETRVAYMMAHQFPRDEDRVRGAIIKICANKSFVADNNAMYVIPMGQSKIRGLSVNIAKEIALAMGNIRYGSYIIADSAESRTIRGWALDLESGAMNELDDSFLKQVQRKQGGQTVWKPTDERELLMLSNNHSSKAIRNCILNVVPHHIKDAAWDAILKTLASSANENPVEFLRAVLDDFAMHGIAPDEVRDFTGTPNLEQLTTKQMTYLRTVANGLAEGQSWKDFLRKMADKEGVGAPESAADLRSKIAAKAAQAQQPTKTPDEEPKKQAEPQADEKKPAAEEPKPRKSRPSTPPIDDPSAGIP